jgi:hypothetical protein
MKIYDLVKSLLEQHPVCRDSDYALVAFVVDHHGMPPAETALKAVLRAMHDGRLPSWHAVERIRRKVQSEHPRLRGTLYHERQAMSSRYASSRFAKGIQLEAAAHTASP